MSDRVTINAKQIKRYAQVGGARKLAAKLASQKYLGEIRQRKTCSRN